MSRINKISEMFDQKTNGFDYYQLHIMDWSNRRLWSTEDFPEGFNQELFSNLTLSGFDWGDWSHLDPNDPKIVAAKQVNNQKKFVIFQGNPDSVDGKFFADDNFSLHLSFLLTYLELCQSDKSIQFLLYGKKNNDLEIIKGKITMEGINWI